MFHLSNIPIYFFILDRKQKKLMQSKNVFNTFKKWHKFFKYVITLMQNLFRISFLIHALQSFLRFISLGALQRMKYFAWILNLMHLKSIINLILGDGS